MPVLIDFSIFIPKKMGFTNELKDTYSAVHLDVYGMKCNSCVKKITEQLVPVDGIHQVSVDLNSNSAVIVYDGAKMDPQQICERINGLGFDARKHISGDNEIPTGDRSSPLLARASLDDDRNEIKTYTVSIEGMVCQSCVRNIEGTMGQKPGIESIKVNLAEKRGVVKFETNLWTASKVAEAIDEMGFDAMVLGEGRGKIEFKRHPRFLRLASDQTCLVHCNLCICCFCIVALHLFIFTAKSKLYIDSKGF